MSATQSLPANRSRAVKEVRVLSRWLALLATIFSEGPIEAGRFAAPKVRWQGSTRARISAWTSESRL